MNPFQKILLASIFLIFGCEEQTIEPDLFGKLAGKVVDDATGLPMANVTVVTNPATQPLETDATGKFDFGQIKTGTYTIRADEPGYLVELASIVLEENDDLDLVLRLDRDSLNNRLPATPVNILPANGAVNQSVNLVFRWEKSRDPNPGDKVKYSILAFASGSSPPDTIAWKISDTTATAKNLKFNTQYFWQVLAFDNSGSASFGEVWSFTTLAAPDNRVIFSRKINGKYDIWSATPDGTSQVQLTSGGANRWRPRWRPDRKKIAFISDEFIDNQIFTMNADGSDIEQITTLPIAGARDIDLDFCWKPDGSQLLYMNGSRLYTINQDGTGLKLFATAPAGFSFSEVDWNGLAKTIAARVTGSFLYESAIYLYNESGVLLSTLVPDDPGNIGGPMFFPDGKRILYTEDAIGFNSPDGRQLDSRLKIKTLATGNVMDWSNLKVAGTNDLDARFSPDASKIIFVNTNNDGVSQRDIWITDGMIPIAARKRILENAEMPDWR